MKAEAKKQKKTKLGFLGSCVCMNNLACA